jgi:hypothetical protein
LSGRIGSDDLVAQSVGLEARQSLELDRGHAPIVRQFVHCLDAQVPQPQAPVSRVRLQLAFRGRLGCGPSRASPAAGIATAELWIRLSMGWRGSLATREGCEGRTQTWGPNDRAHQL